MYEFEISQGGGFKRRNMLYFVAGHVSFVLCFDEGINISIQFIYVEKTLIFLLFYEKGIPTI